MGQQSLIYSFVARGTVILAEYTEFTGNFTGIAAQCLQKLPATNNKFTYNCDGHTFNYLVEDGFSKWRRLRSVCSFTFCISSIRSFCYMLAFACIYYLIIGIQRFWRTFGLLCGFTSLFYEVRSQLTVNILCCLDSELIGFCPGSVL